MATKRTPTFRTEKGLLSGEAAREAWRNQPGARCNCGCRGSEEFAVHGTCKDLPAVWLGCSYHVGQAVGLPLVFRLASQFGD